MQVESLKPLELSDFDALYRRMRQDFPPEELPPRRALRTRVANGDYQAWIMIDGEGIEVAYALCGVFESAVLVTHLAVYGGLRGRGLGGTLLDLLAARYASSARLIVEVERPVEAKNESMRDLRERRIAFYERAGFFCYRALEYSIWRVPMHLMVKPLDGAALPTEAELQIDLHGVYAQLIPPMFRHMVRFP